MRLSTIIELLLIFLLIAFAAYGRVIEPNKVRGIERKSSAVTSSASASLKQATENVNKYCVCNENICNCCRDFHIPLVQLTGPGCASLQYLQDDKLAMQLSIGDNILSSNIVNGKNPKPVCVALPGGFSKFCGKIYSIKREADKHFKACLGLELRSSSELEASLRVSCFRFGPDGLKLRPAEPLPASLTESSSTTSDDDYDDIFGLDDDDDDDDDDDEDDDDEKISPDSNAVSTSAVNEEPDQDPEEEDDEDDPLGFSSLFDIFSGDDDSPSKKKTKVTTPTPLPPSFAIPIISLSTTSAPTSNEASVSKSPLSPSTSLETDISSIISSSTSPSADLLENDDEKNPIETSTNDEINAETTNYSFDTTTKAEIDNIVNKGIIKKIGSAEANQLGEPNKVTTTKTGVKVIDKLKLKKIKVPIIKKIGVTPPSVNLVSSSIKPQASSQTVTNNENDENDDDYESNINEESDEVEDSDEDNVDDEQNEKDESDKHADEEESAQDEDDYEDEDDDEEEEEAEEEEAVLSALIDDEQEKKSDTVDKQKKKVDVVTPNKKVKLQEDDTDYSYELTDLLARKHHSRTTTNQKTTERKSKVMRF